MKEERHQPKKIQDKKPRTQKQTNKQTQLKSEKCKEGETFNSVPRSQICHATPRHARKKDKKKLKSEKEQKSKRAMITKKNRSKEQ
jgi:hypothetical protein